MKNRKISLAILGVASLFATTPVKAQTFWQCMPEGCDAGEYLSGFRCKSCTAADWCPGKSYSLNKGTNYVKTEILKPVKTTAQTKCKTIGLEMFSLLQKNKTSGTYRSGFISALQSLSLKIGYDQQIYANSNNTTYNNNITDLKNSKDIYASLPTNTYFEYNCLELDGVKSYIVTEINKKLQNEAVITFGGATKTGLTSGMMSQSIYTEMEELRNNISDSEIKSHVGINGTTSGSLSPGIYTIVAIGAGGRAGDANLDGKTKNDWGVEVGAHRRGGNGGWASARFVTRLYLDDQTYTAQSYKSCYNSEYDGRASVFKEGNTEILHANGGGGGQTGQTWSSGESDKGASGYVRDSLRSSTPIKYNNGEHSYCEGSCIDGQGGNSYAHGDGYCGGAGAVRIFQITK